jgi:hypothetical protein
MNIIFSWGFHSASALENGLRFMVNGYKYQGEVVIRYNESTDLFNVKFTDTEEEIEDVYADNLVHVIDNHIEYSENYTEQVKQTYNLK